VRCVAIGRADFLELLEAEPAVAVAMLRALAQRFLDELER
jgi:CRP-like cAMP-binding protein